MFAALRNRLFKYPATHLAFQADMELAAKRIEHAKVDLLRALSNAEHVSLETREQIALKGADLGGLHQTIHGLLIQANEEVL